MRRLAAIVTMALLVACGDDGADDGVVDRTRPVPEDVQAFLDRVVEPAGLVADYALLNKNGGAEHEVHVEGDRVTIDGEPVDLGDNGSLATYGIVAGFLTTAPAAQIEATARRADAGDAVFSERGDLDCIQVPVQGAVASTWCLTDGGYFGYVDTPSVRYELVVSG